MKVYLIKDVPNLGKVGEIKEVKNYFAYNFLFPKKLAVLLNDPRAFEMIEEKKEKKQKENEKSVEQKNLAKDLNGKKFDILAKADNNGHLYGSIGPKDLAKETGLSENFFKKHFKEIGLHEIEILIAGETVKITIEIKKI